MRHASLSKAHRRHNDCTGGVCLSYRRAFALMICFTNRQLCNITSSGESWISPATGFGDRMATSSPRRLEISEQSICKYHLQGQTLTLALLLLQIPPQQPWMSTVDWFRLSCSHLGTKPGAPAAAMRTKSEGSSRTPVLSGVLLS